MRRIDTALGPHRDVSCANVLRGPRPPVNLLPLRSLYSRALPGVGHMASGGYQNGEKTRKKMHTSETRDHHVSRKGS